MKVFQRRSSSKAFSRNEFSQTGFRRHAFATHFLLSLLCTLIAFEPCVLYAQPGPPASSVQKPPPFYVEAVPGEGLPHGGWVDHFHNVTGALASSRGRTDVMSPNVAAFMYILRNSTIQAALEKLIGARY